MTNEVVSPPPSTSESAVHGSSGRRGLIAKIRNADALDDAMPVSHWERVVLFALIGAITTINSLLLASELTIPVPSLNDGELHYLFIEGAARALHDGRSLIDFWVPEIETGFPQFVYYQHLPALAVVVLERISLGALDLLTAFNLVRFVLLVGLPLTVYVSVRAMDFSILTAALAALASTLLSGDFRYGFEYDSYLWRGFGMYTQLWAMHLSFLTIAAAYVALQRGRRLWLAALLLGLLVLTHLIYSYMALMAVLLIAIWGIHRANARARLVGLAVLLGVAAAIAAYMWVPFITGTAFLNVTPYLQPEKYTSYGAGPILTWLVSGDLFDHGRLPVVTLLVCIGITAAILRPMPAGRLVVGLLAMWLIAYFGPSTLGVLANLFPLHDGLLFHRFFGGATLAAIILAGIGGAVVWRGLRSAGETARQAIRPARLALATAGIALILAPAVLERASFYAANTAWQRDAMAAVEADAEARSVLDALRELPAGRVFVGLPATYGGRMRFGDLRFFNLLAFYGVEGLARPIESLSLNSDYIWDFDDRDPGSFDLFNARYLIAPTGLAVAEFLSPIRVTPRYTLYEAPTTGYAAYVEIVDRLAVPTRAALFVRNRAWVRSRVQPAARQYLRYDYPAAAPVPGEGAVRGCHDPRTLFELFDAGEINLVVECSTPATLVLKTTYHPNWEVRVDDVVVPDFMVSPSYVGVSLPAGRHRVDATYRPTPIKEPLLVLGVVVALLALGFRRRLDRFVSATNAQGPRSTETGRDPDGQLATGESLGSAEGA